MDGDMSEKDVENAFLNENNIQGTIMYSDPIRDILLALELPGTMSKCTAFTKLRLDSTRSF